MSDSDADVQEERELRPCQVVHVKMPEEMQQSAFEVSAVVVLLRRALCTLNAQTDPTPSQPQPHECISLNANA